MGLIAEPLHQRHSAGLKSHAQLIKRVFLSISAPKTRHLIGCDTARGHNIVGIIEHIGSVKLKTVYPDGSQSFQLLIQPLYSRRSRQIQGSRIAVPPLCDERLSVRIFDEDIHIPGLAVLQGIRCDIRTDPQHYGKTFAVERF